MNSILHRIIIEASPTDVYNALTTAEGLSAWWTKTEIKENITSFFFGPNGEHQVDMEVAEQVPNKKVSWKCVAGPWESTEAFTFTISPDERGTALQFSNSGWAEADEFFMHCNSKWGFFLTVSLKNLLEKGTGQPHPNDPSI